MGEYADDYFRNDVKNRFGFDPGSMYEDKQKIKKPKTNCPVCGKSVSVLGISNHQKDAHGININQQKT